MILFRHLGHDSLAKELPRTDIHCLHVSGWLCLLADRECDSPFSHSLSCSCFSTFSPLTSSESLFRQTLRDNHLPRTMTTTTA